MTRVTAAEGALLSRFCALRSAAWSLQGDAGQELALDLSREGARAWRAEGRVRALLPAVSGLAGALWEWPGGHRLWEAARDLAWDLAALPDAA